MSITRRFRLWRRLQWCHSGCCRLGRVLGVHCILFRPSAVDGLGVLVELHRLSSAQRLVVSAAITNIQLSTMDLLLLLCLCLYTAACLFLLLPCILLYLKTQNGKAQTTVQIGHNSGSYTANMKGCSRKEIDVQSIHNKKSKPDCGLEKTVGRHSYQITKLPSWAHSPRQCHSEMCSLLFLVP